MRVKIVPLFRRGALVVSLALVVVGGYFAVAQAGMICFPTSYSQQDLAAMERDGLRKIAFTTKQGEQAAFYKGPAAGA